MPIISVRGMKIRDEKETKKKKNKKKQRQKKNTGMTQAIVKE